MASRWLIQNTMSNAKLQKVDNTTLRRVYMVYNVTSEYSRPLVSRYLGTHRSRPSVLGGIETLPKHDAVMGQILPRHQLNITNASPKNHPDTMSPLARHPHPHTPYLTIPLTYSRGLWFSH